MNPEITHYSIRMNTKETELQKFYSKLKLDTVQPFIDRYQVLPHFFNIKPFSKPLESNKFFNMTFEDICNMRATSLLNTNKVINIFWSGGLDSTTALISLLSNCKDKNQIRILATYSSIFESGYFYDTFLKPYNTIFDVTHNIKVIDDNEIYLTGGNGNQLFSTGSFNIEDYVKNEKHLQCSYKDIVEPEKYEFYEPALVKSPKPIKTYEDFLWFESFAFKWDHQRFEVLLRYLKPKNIKKYIDTFTGFYYIKEFEQWSIDNNEQQHDTKKLFTTTKMPMRKYISKHLGEKVNDYVNNKRIGPSLFLPFYKTFKYITTDFEVHYVNE